jgi:hypothetical protein
MMSEPTREDWESPAPPIALGTCPKCGRACKLCELLEYGGCESHFADAQPRSQPGHGASKMETGVKYVGLW